MLNSMQKQKSSTPIQFKPFSKYDFVKSLVAAGSNPPTKDDEEKKAAIIADAIEKTQSVLLENLATKRDLKNLEVDLKKDIKNLEIDLKKDIKLLELSLKKEMQGQLIKLGSLIVILLTILPLLTEFLKQLF